MDLDEAERWTRSVARDRREFAAHRPLTVLLAEYDRRGATMVELDVALADAQAEVARLRGEVERYEVLTPQVCPAGEHPEWLIDSEHHHACPWCEIARLRPYLDKAQAHTCPAPDWYLKVRDLLGDVVLAAAFAGTDLADLPEHVRDLHAEVARLRAAVDAVRERHAKYDDGTCWEDGKDWPCPTVFALAAAPAPAEDERVDTCGVCGTDLLDADTSELHWGLCPPCFTAQIDAPAREQADPADEEGECPPICGALGSIHGPGHPCTMPPGHTLHRDGVGCSWAEPDTPAEGVAALLRRCDEIERAGRGLGLGEAGQHISIAEVRALLGGADNNNEGERRG